MTLNDVLNKAAELRELKKEIDIKEKEIALDKARGVKIIDNLEEDLEQAKLWIKKAESDSFLSCSQWFTFCTELDNRVWYTSSTI